MGLPSPAANPGESAIWTEDEPLECCSVVPEAPNVATISFVAPSGAWFRYRPGQFLTLELPVPGGAVWRFRSDHEASLQESIYFASGAPRKSLQIVLAGEADSNGDGAAAPNRVMWRLTPTESA